MRRKIAGTVGSVLLCAVLLAGCSNGASTADSTAASSQQETASSTAASEVISKEEKEHKAALEESARKFKSAENYQESGEYFKAYSLYQRVIEDDSNYPEAQKRAAEMLDLYWKQQDSLVEQGEYQQAIENTLDVMSFLNMTSPLDNDMGLERTILQVAEKLADNCGFMNPKAAIDANATDWYSKIYSIDIECDGINGTSLESMSKAKILQKHSELSEKFNEVIYRASFGTFCRFLLGNLHFNGKWYNVIDDKLTIRTDAEQEEYIKSIVGKDSWKPYSFEFSDRTGNSDSSESSTVEVTQEFKNALETGLRYANGQQLSKDWVYKQLIHDGFSADAAQYAINNMDDVDWEGLALERAQRYYYSMSLSKETVRKQLIHEGFTTSQAQYAVDNLN